MSLILFYFANDYIFLVFVHLIKIFCYPTHLQDLENKFESVDIAKLLLLSDEARQRRQYKVVRQGGATTHKSKRSLAIYVVVTLCRQIFQANA